MIKLLTALAVAITAAIGIWMKYYSKSARIERLEKKAKEYEQKWKEALDNNDTINHWLYYHKWVHISERIGSLRQ